MCRQPQGREMSMMDVDSELARLNACGVRELRNEYGRRFGERAFSRHKPFLIKRILWRMQGGSSGGLSAESRRRAAELAVNAEFRLCPPDGAVISGRLRSLKIDVAPLDPPPGTELVKIYKGRRISVKLEENGVVYAGRLYRSLSAVAKEISGSHLSGRAFFGLRPPGGKGGAD